MKWENFKHLAGYYRTHKTETEVLDSSQDSRILLGLSTNIKDDDEETEKIQSKIYVELVSSTVCISCLQSPGVDFSSCIYTRVGAQHLSTQAIVITDGGFRQQLNCET